MERRDYVLRLIEQMGAALVALRNRILRRAGEPRRIGEELTELAGRGGLDMSLLRGLTAETLHLLVSPSGEVEPGRCWLVAELLYLDGLQAQVEERWADARESLEKSRLLYALIAPVRRHAGRVPGGGRAAGRHRGAADGARGSLAARLAVTPRLAAGVRSVA